MVVMRLGLTIAALGFLIVLIGSIRAGYPPEMALVRGLLAFMALSFVGYLGELVVATSPNAGALSGDGREGSDGALILSADDQAKGLTQGPGEPVGLPEPRNARPAA